MSDGRAPGWNPRLIWERGVELMEIPTAVEYVDNIVAAWRQMRHYSPVARTILISPYMV